MSSGGGEFLAELDRFVSERRPWHGVVEGDDARGPLVRVPSDLDLAERGPWALLTRRVAHMRARELPDGRDVLLVLLVLVAHASERTWEAWPSLALICEEAGAMSRRRVIAALDALIEAGLVARIASGGSHRPARYRLLPHETSPSEVDAFGPLQAQERTESSPAYRPAYGPAYGPLQARTRDANENRNKNRTSPNPTSDISGELGSRGRGTNPRAKRRAAGAAEPLPDAAPPGEIAEHVEAIRQLLNGRPPPELDELRRSRTPTRPSRQPEEAPAHE